MNNKNKKTNVLWIFVDQLRYHSLSCNGDPNVSTPNIDRLASEGVNFSNAYSTCPVCTPARASVITGQYGTVNNVKVLGDILLPDQLSIAKAFNDSGYKTSYYGKWHMASTQNAVGHNEGIDFWVHPALRGGFQDWFAFEISNNFYKSTYSTGDKMWPPTVVEGYQTDTLTDLSLKYLKDNCLKNSEKPFFHVLSLETPHHGKDQFGNTTVKVGEYEHTRHPAPKEYEDMFKPDELVLRENVPEDFADVARSQNSEYYAQIANLDMNIGKILNFLDDNKLADNTLVCFFSDHGEMGGSHHQFQKACFYDESIKIPFIMRLPDSIPSGIVTDKIAGSIDLFPTTASICKVPVPDSVHGINLFSKDSNRDSILIQWHGNFRYSDDEKGEAEWRCIRTKKYTYSRGMKDYFNQLYDNESDPYQKTNVFNNPEYINAKEKLQKMLEQDILSSGEEIPEWVADLA